MTETPAQRLAAYVRRAALAAGYDVDAPRRGGDMTRLAKDAGISLTTLSRLLSGERLPDPRYYEALAIVLHVPVADLLIEGGIISARTAERLDVRLTPISPEQAADELGIVAPADRELFLAMVERLQRYRSSEGESARKDPHDHTA